MIDKCPGALRFREAEPENVKCPSCGKEVEIWTDEIKRKCPNCKEIVLREEESSCLEWCKYAKECVGDTVYNRFMSNKLLTLREKLISEVGKYFGEDTKRIQHAKMVMSFSEELLKKEGGDPHIVIPSSILHDIGIKEAERRYGSNAGSYQEKEGPPIARKILLEQGLQMEEIDEICQIIAHHHSPGKVKTKNFEILYDADQLVNLKDKLSLESKKSTKTLTDKLFYTKTAREIAKTFIS